MIDVTVKVPESRLADFYAMYGRWLGGNEPVAPGGSETEWSPSDLRIAKEFWGKLSEPAKGLFSTLMEKPGQKFSAAELARKVEIPNGKYGVAGAIAWPARHAAALGRSLPCKREGSASEDGADYWMTPELAALFLQVQ